MDYSQLSDAEIAQKVWFWWNENVEHDNTLCGMSGGKMLYVKNEVWTVFDPCNNPADAWPIILNTKIQIYWLGDTWGTRTKHTPVIENDNPLRAAMIVFLMTQDSNHA